MTEFWRLALSALFPFGKVYVMLGLLKLPDILPADVHASLLSLCK